MANESPDHRWSGGALLGLDIGSRRVGVSLVRADVHIAQPLTTLEVDDGIFEAIGLLSRQHGVEMIVAGWPRGMAGQHTAQTVASEQFVASLRAVSDVPIVLQDEALTSQRAETELQARGKSFERGQVDALAATYILEDYMSEHAPGAVV